MLYVKYDKDGNITGLVNEKADGSEVLDISRMDVRDFLEEQGIPLSDALGQSLKASDTDLARVLEDVITVLLNKGVINLTDLPPKAVAKLSGRKRIRRQRGDLENLVVSSTEELPI